MSALHLGSIYARALLSEVPQAEANLESLVARLNLEVGEVDVEGFDGALVRARELPLGAIVVRESIREDTRKRFTIAHEIGHFLLPGHDDEDLVCTPADVGNWSDAARDREREADEFAAEVLLPRSIVEPLMKGVSPALRVVEQIATTCRTSLSAAAWRYCDLTDEPCAVVWSTGGRIEWSKRSRRFRFVLNKGASIRPGTFAQAASAAARGPAEPRPVPAGLWVHSDSLAERAQIWEQSRALPNYESVLTLLWIPNPA